MMKTETIKIKTSKSVQQISNALRTFNCNVDHYTDPLQTEYPSLSVMMYGRPRFLELFSHPGGADALWEVHVAVHERPDHCMVILTAVGTGYWGAGWHKYKTGEKSPMIEFSKDYMYQIAQVIK